jgi:hypothetical protein
MTQGSSGPHGDQQQHLIRRSGHIVHDRPPLVVCWIDVLNLSALVACYLAAWQQVWQQSPADSAVQDPKRISSSGREPFRSVQAGPAFLIALSWMLPYCGELQPKLQPADHSLFDCPAACRGWPASCPARLWPGPWSLSGGGAERLRGQGWPKVISERKREAPLTVEGALPHTKQAIPGPARRCLCTFRPCASRTRWSPSCHAAESPARFPRSDGVRCGSPATHPVIDASRVVGPLPAAW